MAVATLLCALMTALPVEESAVVLTTASGASFTAVIGLPDGTGPFPAVVIAPGRGYHMGLPLVNDLSKELRRQGITTVRFDWLFFTNQTNPSDGRTVEREQIEACLGLLKSKSEVEQTKIGIVGKSLGSVVAWNAFRNSPEVKALVMLTPIMPDEPTALRLHPGIDEEQRDIVWIVGDNDAENCSLPVLYKVVAEAKPRSRIVVLQGGHAFERGEEESPENTKAAIGAVGYWLQRLFK